MSKFEFKILHNIGSAMKKEYFFILVSVLLLIYIIQYFWYRSREEVKEEGVRAAKELKVEDETGNIVKKLMKKFDQHVNSRFTC